MSELNHDISTYLLKELAKRKLKNHQYSLRALAKQLQMEPSLLSKIIRQKIIPTPKTVEKLSACLNIESNHKAQLIDNYKKIRQDKHIKYQKAKSDFLKLKTPQNWPFKSWNELLVFSTLGLSAISDLKALATSIEMEPSQVLKLLNRLIAANLVEKKEEGYSLKVKQVADEVPIVTSELKKTIQKKFLKEAIRKIDEVDLEHRLNGTLTFTVDPRLLPKLKSRIAQFMQELNAMAVAQSAQASVVYNCTLALYPLKRKGRKCEN